MPDRPQLSVSSDLLSQNSESGILKQTGQAFLHSLIQSPLNGVVQISDKAFGTNALPSVQIIEAPKEASFGTKEWHAQQIGQAAGMVPWFIGLHKGSAALLGRAVGATAGAGVAAEVNVARNAATAAEANFSTKFAEGFLNRKTAVEVSASALSGLSYGAIFTPVKPGENFLAGRATNAVSSALTFGTLSASMRGLDVAGLKSYTAAGALSGIPAGIVAAESHSLLSGKGAASLADVGKSVYGFSIIGGGFGFAQGRIEASTTKGKAESAPLAEATKAAADTTAGGKNTLGPELAALGDAGVAPGKLRVEPLRPSDTPLPEVQPAAEPTDITVGQKIAVQRDGQPSTVEVAATTERMIVLKEERPQPIDEGPYRISQREFEQLVPIEVSVDGRPQTRYIYSSETQKYSGVYEVQKVGDRYRLTEDPNFSAVNRPEMGQWVDTPRLKSGTNGAPAVDWTLVPDLRAELNGFGFNRGPSDLLRGHETVYSGSETRSRQNVSLRSRGDTQASASELTGTIVLEKPGQPWVAELKDGRCITMESPGPWEVVTPASKRVISKDADGHVKIRDWDGQVQHIIRNPAAPQHVIILGAGPNGIPLMERLPANTPPPPLRTLMQHADYAGGEKLLLSDGTRVEYQKSGKWEGVRPDGSRFNAESNGPWEINERNGMHLSKDAAGVLRRTYNGQTTTTYPDGTKVTDNFVGYAGASGKEIRFTDVQKPGEPTRQTYEDPAVPGQKVTQIHRIAPDSHTRINNHDFDWEATRPNGDKFNYDSPGPWEVSLPDQRTIVKDAEGNLTLTGEPTKVEYRANGDKIFTDRNSTRLVKPDKTVYTLYNGCKTWLKQTPDGRKTEVADPYAPEPTPHYAVPPVGDPFSFKDY